MFDDINNSQDPAAGSNSANKPNAAGSPPAGLPRDLNDQKEKPAVFGGGQTTVPATEVEDMLEPTDSGSSPAVVTSNNPLGNRPTGVSETPAYGGEIFQPAPPPIMPGSPAPQTPSDEMIYSDNENPKKKMLLVGIIIVGLLLLAIGSYLAYQKFFVQGDNFILPSQISPEAENNNTADPQEQPAETTAVEEESDFSKDTDGDGLTDEEELGYNTDPELADSDRDGLFDREEVITWKTDPLNPDSDQDSYLDGEEVKRGYNPLGPGRLDFYPFVE